MKKVILLLMLGVLLWQRPIYAMANDDNSTETEISELYTCGDEVTNDTCLTITQEEAEMLMKIAVMEDYTDVESQAWIMMVILNRVDSPDFPDSIKEVLSQQGQFTSFGSWKYRNAEPDANSHLALAMVEGGHVATEALYFEAIYCKDSWQSRNLELIKIVGSSRFYK